MVRRSCFEDGEMVEQIALESSGGGWVQHQVGKQRMCQAIQ